MPETPPNAGAVIEGGCACKKIRFSIRTPPMMMMNCHCSDCRHATGSSHFPVIVVALDDFTVLAGEPRYFETKSVAGTPVFRGFCGDCGSPLMGKTESHPDTRIVSASALDDPTLYAPQAAIFTDGLPNWAKPEDGLPCFPGNPPH